MVSVTSISFFTGEREFPSYITSEALSSDEQPHQCRVSNARDFTVDLG